MARHAIRIECRAVVRGIRRRIKVFIVAADTLRRGAGVLAIDVTGCAIRLHVRAIERELCLIVIGKLGGAPRGCRMTRLAGIGESRGFVCGVLCALVVRLMTRDASA